MNRSETFNELRRSAKVDVCVIGGGINGISTFRELGLQGLRVLLIEQNDYCSGASAALSRMVHGGLRYLENGEFTLVKEALVERDRLLKNAPHYVAPLPTVVPIFDRFSGLGNGLLRFMGRTKRPSRRGALAVKIGLSIYDVLTRNRRQMPNHEFRNRSATLAKWPDLDPNVKYSATYYDASISHPERLGLELLLETKAVRNDALSLNYANIRLVAPSTYQITDQISGETVEIKPRVIVNATGGWIDIANRGLMPASQPHAKMMGGTKGSHLIIRNERLRKLLNNNMIYYENADGRICILFPYLDQVLLGSTDIRIDDPATARCEADERDYMLQSLKYVLPKIDIAPEEVIFQFSGVRPLPASNDSFTGRIPRDHFCKKIEATADHPPIFCLVGGKWTTFRSFGALAADDIFRQLELKRVLGTENRAIGGGKDYPDHPSQWISENAQRIGIAVERLATLFERYGTLSAHIARFIVEEPDRPLPSPAQDYSTREILYLCESEEVEHLSDLLIRRTTIAINGKLTHSVIDDTLSNLASVKHWDQSASDIEKQTFLALLAERHGVIFSGADLRPTTTGASNAQ